MTLNHINIPVPDVAKTRAFFETHFSFRCFVEKGADTFAGLTDDEGLVFALSNFDHVDQVEYPKLFHVGFMQDSDEKVHEIHARLKREGVDAEDPKEEHGSLTFYFTAPGGFLVEVLHQRDQDAPK